MMMVYSFFYTVESREDYSKSKSHLDCSAIIFIGAASSCRNSKREEWEKDIIQQRKPQAVLFSTATLLVVASSNYDCYSGAAVGMSISRK